MKGFLSIFAFAFILPQLTIAQCTSCTSTNPTNIPANITSGMRICFTQDRVFNGAINLNGGNIYICSGAHVRLNGQVSINSVNSSITLDGCSSVYIDGSTFNSQNPNGLLVMDGCNCNTAFTITGNIQGFGPVCFSPLPVELGAFEVNCDKGTINIDWATYSEQNNNFFLVEKSQDLNHWTTVAKVSGAGNSNTLLNYSVKDENPSKGISYYRLTQVDFDGSFETFEAKSVSCETSNDITVMVYPNPASSFISVNAADMEDGLSNWTITNSAGSTILSGQTTVVSGRINQQLDISSLQPGLYFIRIGNEVQSTVKFLVN